jgi:PadR family transcriptional regulator, regulatory protein PadR
MQVVGIRAEQRRDRRRGRVLPREEQQRAQRGGRRPRLVPLERRSLRGTDFRALRGAGITPEMPVAEKGDPRNERWADDLLRLRRDGGERSRVSIRLGYAGMLRCMVPGGEAKLLAQLRRGSIEYCVLALLRDGDRYGFELTRTLAQADGLVTSEGTVYPLLARLRQDGLVETTWRESSQGPPRRYYRLTRDGRRALDAFIVQWRRFRDAIDGVLEEESANGRSGRGRDSESVFPQA